MYKFWRTTMSLCLFKQNSTTTMDLIKVLERGKEVLFVGEETVLKQDQITITK